MQLAEARAVERWPNFFVVGAAKAGTTSLYEHLRRHPQIYLSPVKEPHFFSRVKPAPGRDVFFGGVADAHAYLELFEGASSQPVIGEASTSYLWDAETPARIHAVRPDAKIVIMLREPVSRAYSHYLNDVREGIERRTFADALREDLATEPKGWGVSSLYVELGLYCEQVARYLRRFPRENVLVLLFEEFVRGVPSELDRVFAFLRVERIELPSKTPARNPYARPRSRASTFVLGTPGVRRVARRLVPPRLRPFGKRLLLARGEKPALDEDARQLLAGLYAGQAACLERLLGRPVPWERE